MSESDPREFAQELKQNHSALSDVPLEDITFQIQSLRASDVPDSEIKKIIIQMAELQSAVEDHVEQESSPGPKEINVDVESLPDELTRDDWR